MRSPAKYATLFVVVAPFVCAIAAIAVLYNDGISTLDLALLVGWYVPTVMGITVGFHRLLTHRSFQTPRPVRALLAIFGSLAVQGDPISWVADHRKHHAFTDVDGDPHSPHGHGDGIGGVLKGFYYAHIGWFWQKHSREEWERYAPELIEDPTMLRIAKLFPVFAVMTFVLPGLVALAITGSQMAFTTGVFWGGFVRVFFVHHVTWSINSVCHLSGRTRFAVDEADESRNVAWLSLLSMGESWHHNHHAFPRSAAHGLKRWEIDPSAMVIGVMERVGLASHVVRITPQRQAERLLANGAQPTVRQRAGAVAASASASASAVAASASASASAVAASASAAAGSAASAAGSAASAASSAAAAAGTAAADLVANGTTSSSPAR